jgi:uncharacterized membrane protein
MSQTIIFLLLIDVFILGIILILYFYKPKNMKSIIAYRTKLSMKNERNWKFAQDYFPQKLFIAIPIMLISQIPILFDVNDNLLIYISVANFPIILIYAISSTENALKKLDE